MELLNSGQLSQDKLWNTLYGHTGQVNSVCFSPDGLTLASASSLKPLDYDSTVRLWSVISGDLSKTFILKTFIGHTKAISSLYFFSDGDTLVGGGEDGKIRFWSAKTSQLLNTLIGHTDIVSSLYFYPNRKNLASGSEDGTMRLWSITTGQLLKVFTVNTDAKGLPLKTRSGNTDWIEGIVFGPDGRKFASFGSEDGKIRLWSAVTGIHIKTFEGHTWRVESVAFSPNGRTLASGGSLFDPTVRLWSVTTGELLNTLEGHKERIWSVAFSPDGSMLASGSLDTKICLWSVTTGELLNTLLRTHLWYP